MTQYFDYQKPQQSRRSSLGTVATSSFKSLPWDKLFSVYKNAADSWEEMATLAQQEAESNAYEHHILQLEGNDLGSESGAYEGNRRDENPQTNKQPLVNRARGRRRAGQRAVIDDFLTTYKFGDFSTSIMPEIITLVGNMPVTRLADGTISGTSFVRDNFTTDSLRGLWVFLMLDSRSGYLQTQYKGTSKPYSTLVPLILYAQRLVKGFKYSEWSRDELRQVVNSDLADAMLFDTKTWPTREQLLSGREQGLTVGSGKDMGKKRSPISTYKLYATTGTCYQGLPPCLQVMLAQIWVAHPDNRTKYMVLDPLNWDKVPLPLVDAEPIQQQPDYPIGTLIEQNDLPWGL